MLFKLFQSLLGMGISYLIIRYRKDIYDWTGPWSWAETYVGNTVNAIVLLGCVLLFISIARPLGAFDNIQTRSTTIHPMAQQPDTSSQN